MDAFLDFSIVPGSERAFGLFSPLHILWLLAALAAWLLLCRRYRRCTPARRVRMRRVTAGAALAIEPRGVVGFQGVVPGVFSR